MQKTEACIAGLVEPDLVYSRFWYLCNKPHRSEAPWPDLVSRSHADVPFVTGRLSIRDDKRPQKGLEHFTRSTGTATSVVVMGGARGGGVLVIAPVTQFAIHIVSQ